MDTQSADVRFSLHACQIATEYRWVLLRLSYTMTTQTFSANQGFITNILRIAKNVKQDNAIKYFPRECTYENKNKSFFQWSFIFNYGIQETIFSMPLRGINIKWLKEVDAIFVQKGNIFNIKSRQLKFLGHIKRPLKIWYSQEGLKEKGTEESNA